MREMMPTMHLADERNTTALRLHGVNVTEAENSDAEEVKKNGAAFTTTLLQLVSQLLDEQPGRTHASCAATSDKEDREETPLDGNDMLRDEAGQQLLNVLLATYLPSEKPLATETSAFYAGTAALALPKQARVTRDEAAQTNSELPLVTDKRDLAVAVAQQPIMASSVEQPTVSTNKAVAANSTESVSISALTSGLLTTPPPVTVKADSSNTVNPQVTSHDVANMQQLSGDQARWSEQLQHVLGERLRWQLSEQVQQATLRLSPPEMGKIDIALQLGEGRMHVHIAASHADVYRTLQQSSDELRQMLSEHNGMEVDFSFSPHAQDGKQHAFSDAETTAHPDENVNNEAETQPVEATKRKDATVLLTI